ncbi:MAG: DEAD/DEAH box helicase [Alphaproteobacteria bacterium]
MCFDDKTHLLGILKDVFGYTELRSGQDEVLKAVMAGEDVLAVMPTGAGKSMCYQLPALAREGLTIVRADFRRLGRRAAAAALFVPGAIIEPKRLPVPRGPQDRSVGHR